MQDKLELGDGVGLAEALESRKLSRYKTRIRHFVLKQLIISIYI